MEFKKEFFEGLLEILDKYTLMKETRDDYLFHFDLKEYIAQMLDKYEDITDLTEEERAEVFKQGMEVGYDNGYDAALEEIEDSIGKIRMFR